MKNTTVADLVLSGRAAAQKAFAAPNSLETQNVKLAAFKASGFDPLDFPMWETTFNAEIEMLTHFGKQDSPATEKAKRDAAKAEADAKAKADEAAEAAAKAAKSPTGNPLN